MTRPPEATTTTRVLRALENDNPSVRLRTALAAGTTPDPRFVGRLIERCAVEPDFSVREMLTWALTRHPADLTVPGLIGELRSPRSRARSQALHTLSKIGDRRAWPAITPALLTEADDEVARSAWRASGGTGPALLAEALDAPQADVRERAVRSLAEIPGDDTTAVLRAALTSSDLVVRRHAALALAARGLDDAVPTLLDMIVEGVKDADAADALSTLAGGPASAERITAGLTGRLGHAAGDPGARRRLTQALADVPGPAAGRALAELTGDEDRVVALTATSVLRLRGRSEAALPS